MNLKLNPEKDPCIKQCMTCLDRLGLPKEHGEIVSSALGSQTTSCLQICSEIGIGYVDESGSEHVAYVAGEIEGVPVVNTL